MTLPPNDPRSRISLSQWSARVDEEITFDEVRRAVFGQRLRDDHSTVLKDPLPERMKQLLRAMEAIDVAAATESRRDHS